jgi:RND family efflux transporter MFP subunit
MTQTIRLVRFLIMPAAAATLLACSSGEKSPGPSSEVVRGVQLEMIRLATVPEVYEAVGTVRSVTTSVVGAQIVGTVLETRAKPGDHVRRGQLLALLDDRSLRAQLGAAEAGVEEAAEGLEEIEHTWQAAVAEREFAEATFRRYQELLAKNSVSRQEFDGAESRYKAALANQRALEAKKKQIEARGRQARSQRSAAETLHDYSRVVAPIGGVVAAKWVDAGTLVMPGAPLFTVENAERYRLEAELPERYMDKAALGLLVKATVEGREWSGRVAEIVPAADPSTRTSVIKIDLPPACPCRSGQYGTAAFPIGEARRLTVPPQAVVERGGLQGVFVRNGQGLLEFRLVKTGMRREGLVEILSGLTEGEVVAASQLESLRDGARVEAP